MEKLKNKTVKIIIISLQILAILVSVIEFFIILYIRFGNDGKPITNNEIEFSYHGIKLLFYSVPVFSLFLFYFPKIVLIGSLFYRKQSKVVIIMLLLFSIINIILLEIWRIYFFLY